MGSRYLIWVSFLASLALSSTGRAEESEPNDVCPGQPMGMPALPFSVAGSLDTPPADPDLDIFQFSFTPGAQVRADLQGAPSGAGTLEDPLIGLYDADCEYLTDDDDGGDGFDSRLVFTVPDDGVFSLAVTGYPDFAFEGLADIGGSYVLTLTEAPPAIVSISGRLVDTVSGEALSGDAPTYSAIALGYCEEECIEVGYEIPGTDGSFSFDGEFYGLRAGNYQLAGFALGYGEGEPIFSELFTVGAGEAFDFGDFGFEPDPIQFSDMRRCGPRALDRNYCGYSLMISNRSASPFVGRVWSLVDYYSPGAQYAYAFQVGKGGAFDPQPRYLQLEPGESKRVAFRLPVPGSWTAVDDGGLACLSVFVGRAPYAVHNGVSAADFGCLTRTGAEQLEFAPQQTLQALRRPAPQRAYGGAPRERGAAGARDRLTAPPRAGKAQPFGEIRFPGH